MKIKSRFKDYYDHVAHRYGGGDPKVVYTRAPLADNQLLLTIESKDNKVFNAIRNYRHFVLNVDYKIICAAGRAYVTLARRAPFSSFIYTDEEFKLFSKEDFPEMYDHLFNRRRFYGDSKIMLADFLGQEMGCLTEIAKTIGSPVFAINLIRYDSRDKWVVSLDKNIPILQEYGIASLVPAEQMYQELEYFVSNRMKESPDMMPKTVMSDKEKISQHGFDLKKSFRHRIEEKK